MRKHPLTTPSQLRVCVLGDLRHHEFAAAAAWLHDNVAELVRVRWRERSFLRSLTTSATAIDLLVVACPRRGDFTASHIKELRNAAPLARIIALTGGWCDGPWRRPCDLLPGVTLVPWHRFATWAAVNLQQRTRRRAASWSLPETSTADELADFWSVQPLSDSGGLILIDATDAESAEVLAEVVRAGGYSAVWQSPVWETRSASFGDSRSESPTLTIDGVRAMVCEVNDARPATLERIAQLSRRDPSAPVVAVVNFPRAEDIEQILAAGAAGVVAKPFTLHEILAQLGDALRRKGESRVAAA